ncbi:hypothetical protein [Helicobacter pullorum]|uniref:hypothetical protein n=1 Tax=Helicobacter pullorum TaxID=35818 RepID=UPI0015CF726B|nr:hypothetical protein [Helicobacter pullorum]
MIKILFFIITFFSYGISSNANMTFEDFAQGIASSFISIAILFFSIFIFKKIFKR